MANHCLGGWRNWWQFPWKKTSVNSIEWMNKQQQQHYQQNQWKYSPRLVDNRINNLRGNVEMSTKSLIYLILNTSFTNSYSMNSICINEQSLDKSKGKITDWEKKTMKHISSIFIVNMIMRRAVDIFNTFLSIRHEKIQLQKHLIFNDYGHFIGSFELFEILICFHIE